MPTTAPPPIPCRPPRAPPRSRPSSHPAAEECDVDLADVLAHDLFRVTPELASMLRLSYAEALSAEDHHEAAVACSQGALAALREMGAAVPAIEGAIAVSHLIGAGRLDDADAGFEELLASYDDDDDRMQVLFIAADTFAGEIEYAHAARWAERHLRYALDCRPRPVAQIEEAVRALTMVATHVTEWAEQYPRDADELPTIDADLLHEADRVLDEGRRRLR